MPRVSERQQSLSLLRELLRHYYEADWLRRMVPFLPELYEHLRSKRYWATRDTVYKIGSWTPNLMSLRDDVRFQRDARMDKKTFFQLLATIENSSVFNRGGTPGKHQLLVALQLSVFLAYLSSGGIGGSDFALSQRFAIGEGTVSKIIMRVTTAILDLVPAYIRWPSSSVRHQIACRIEARSGFRGVCGVVDGTAFPLAFKPQHDPEDYFNRKSIYCISAQIFCDDQRIIRKIFVGFPGSVHDMRQFKFTSVYQHPENHFDKDQYLLGDAAYALSPTLVGPNKSPASERPRNKRFNYLLSTERIAIEHTIGILKARFGRLSEGFRHVIREKEDNQRVVSEITAACVLHNFCVVHKDTFECDYELPDGDGLAQDPCCTSQLPLDIDNMAVIGKEWRSHIQDEVLAFNGY